MLLCQFLVLAGNRQFFVVAGKFYYDRKKLSVQYSCAVVSVFLLWRESSITTGKKKVLVVCLAGCAVVSVFGSGGK